MPAHGGQCHMQRLGTVSAPGSLWERGTAVAKVQGLREIQAGRRKPSGRCALAGRVVLILTHSLPLRALMPVPGVPVFETGPTV